MGKGWVSRKTRPLSSTPPQICHPERRLALLRAAVEGSATPPTPAHRSTLSAPNLHALLNPTVTLKPTVTHRPSNRKTHRSHRPPPRLKPCKTLVFTGFFKLFHVEQLAVPSIYRSKTRNLSPRTSLLKPTAFLPLQISPSTTVRRVRPDLWLLTSPPLSTPHPPPQGSPQSPPPQSQ
jgi:hypothetical protein